MAGVPVAFLGLWWSDRYVHSLDSHLWVIVLAAAGMSTFCGLLAYRERIAVARGSEWISEASRLSAEVQAAVTVVRDLHTQLTHPDGALRLAMKVELRTLAKADHGESCPDCGEEIAKLKKAISALESLVVPETAIYLRGFMDGQGDGEGEPDSTTGSFG
jgi:hypothetical protein